MKALLLSALVFPGLGQLYKQDRRKGIVLILMANILLATVFLAGAMILAEEYMTLVYPQALTGENLRKLLAQTVSRPLFFFPAILWVAVWAFATADALLAPVPREKPADDSH